jgi:hypothetical protein
MRPAKFASDATRGAGSTDRTAADPARPKGLLASGVSRAPTTISLDTSSPKELNVVNPPAAKRPAAPEGWSVVWHQEAVVELNEIKELRARKAVLSVADILRQIGPKLVEPHCKKVQGADKLYELRPGGGRVLFRPLYARRDERTFVVLGIAPEAMTDPGGFERAVKRARERAEAHFGWVV